MSESNGERAPRAIVSCMCIRAGARLPVRMTEGASGFDLHACLENPIRLEPGRWTLIPTGLVMEIPRGLEGAVRARSGLAFKYGIGVLNGPGTIDSDYRGEVGVLLMNWGPEPFEIRSGDRIAQIVFQTVPAVDLVEADVDRGTPRGSGGFGHTGTSADAGRQGGPGKAADAGSGRPAGEAP